MVLRVHESAPAKINLNLKVLPKRGDGYHDIESIFQLIPLCDELEAFATSDVGCCKVTADGMELPVDNTITATYTAFRAVTGISTGVSVTVKKNIPNGAGLGGGSSDAAAMVRILSRLFNKELSVSQCSTIAEIVGSDVFFFLLCNPVGSSGCALVTGRGERVFPIQPRKDLFFVLVCPDVHSSTPKAYSLVDGYTGQGKNCSFPEFSALETVYRKNPAIWTFANSFTEPLVKEYPLIASAIVDIRATGALYTQMSGSGASVYGVFTDADAAQAAYNSLCRKWEFCRVLTST